MYASPMALLAIILVGRVAISSPVQPLRLPNLQATCDTAKEGHPPYPEIADCMAIQNRDLPRDPGDLSSKPTWSPNRPTKAIYRVPQRFRHRTCAAELTFVNGAIEEKGYWSDVNHHIGVLDSVCWSHRWPPPKRDFLGGFLRFGDSGNLQLRIMYNGPLLIQSNETQASSTMSKTTPF